MENNNQTIIPDKKHPLFFWGICLVLLLPMVILPPAFQPADWSRAALFRTIITALIFILFLKFLYKKDLSFCIPKWKISTYSSFLILTAFFIVLVLATIFSEDIRFSIFGSPIRAGGTLNLLFFFIFTVFLTLFINENNWKKLFSLLFIVGVLASLLAIIQYFNIFKNVFISYGGGNTPSFLGDSTFLAIYMLFLTFLSFTRFIQEKIKKTKIIYAALFSLFIFTVLITNSRATYLGMLVGFFYFFFFYPKKLKALKIFAASLVLFVIIVIVFSNFSPQVVEKNRLLKTVFNKLSIKAVAKDLVGTRFSAWKITLKTIKDKPIFGWGPENFYIGFEKYYDPTISDIKNTWWDRPHNIFLDIAASSGIPSTILYLLFWILLLWQLQILKRQQGENEKTYLAHGLQAMFIGYLVVLFFNFDSFSTYLISFFFIGFSFYLISGQSERKIIYSPKTNAIKTIKNKFIYVPILIFLIYFIWFWNIKPLYLKEEINYAEALTNAKKCEDGLSTIDKVWQSGGILKSYSGLRYSDLIKDCVPYNPDKKVDYSRKAVEALKASSEIQPKFTRTWMFLGNFSNVLAEREGNTEIRNKLLLEAKNYLEKALKLSPKRQEIFIEMEKNYLMVEDYQTMKKIAYDCIAIDSSYGQCYWYLGIAEIFLGDQENGKKHIQEMEKKSDSVPRYVQLGVAYVSQKNYKDAADAYSQAIRFDNKNASYRAVLAFLYRELGEYSLAAEEAVRVFGLQPGNEEVQIFLEQMLDLSPNNPVLHSSLAYIYNQTGKIEKARQEYLINKSLYLQALEKYPKNPDYHFSLAVTYKELGEYEKAYQEALIVEKLDPENFYNQVMNLILSLPLENYWKKYQPD